MPHLDHRLAAVAKMIRWPVHVDIGADHGHLVAALLASGRIERGIAIENKAAPLANAKRTLGKFGGEVRLADGLDGIAVDDHVDGISLCGVGGKTIVSILSRSPDRLPMDLILQPNKDAGVVRRFAMDFRYAIVDETIIPARQRYFDVIALRRRGNSDPNGDRQSSPSPDNFEFDYGPLNLKRRGEVLIERLTHDLGYLNSLSRLGDDDRRRRDSIRTYLEIR